MLAKYNYGEIVSRIKAGLFYRLKQGTGGKQRMKTLVIGSGGREHAISGDPETNFSGAPRALLRARQRWHCGDC